jgi:hypothetical protein
MITAHDKAVELVYKFQKYSADYRNSIYSSFEAAKQCALIAVDEIINILKFIHKPEYTKFVGVSLIDKEHEERDIVDGYELIYYYEEVKEEITNLK